MKIQILGPPRSGTTCLYEALRDNINYSSGIFEPINPHWNYQLTSDYKVNNHLNIINNSPINIIEKNVVLDFNLKEEFNKYLNFYKSYLKNFDKVIFLCRENINDQAKSVKISSISNNWHKPYKDIKVDYKEWLPILKLKNEFIIKLSNELHIPITFYEDLYSNNINYLNSFLKYYSIELNDLQGFYNKMNTKNRLKQL